MSLPSEVEQAYFAHSINFDVGISVLGSAFFITEAVVAACNTLIFNLILVLAALREVTLGTLASGEARDHPWADAHLLIRGFIERTYSDFCMQKSSVDLHSRNTHLLNCWRGVV